MADNLAQIVSDILKEEFFQRDILPPLNYYSQRPIGSRLKSIMMGTSLIDDAIFNWLQEQSDELDFEWPKSIEDSIYKYGREKYPHALSRSHGKKEVAVRKVISAIFRIHRNFLFHKRREREDQEFGFNEPVRSTRDQASSQKPDRTTKTSKLDNRVKWLSPEEREEAKRKKEQERAQAKADKQAEKERKKREKEEEKLAADPRNAMSDDEYIEDVLGSWMQEKAEELEFKWPQKLIDNIFEYGRDKFIIAIARENGNRKIASRKIVSAINRLYRTYLAEKRKSREEKIERLAGIYDRNKNRY